jgi:phosphohistidine swiveling domain-containing protein
VLADATLTSHMFLSDGATHVRIDELADLYERLTAAARDDPAVPQRLAKHFVAVGEHWVAHCAEHLGERAHLATLDDDEIAARLDEFCSLYSAYAPALYLPFPIERLYAEEFPALLSRIAGGLGEELLARVVSRPELSRYADLGLVRVVERDAIERAIRPILEYAPERTDAERKDAALNRLARGLIDAFGIEALPASPDELADTSAALAAQLDALTAEFAWIAQWGYPPRYAASTTADLLNEALVRAEASIVRARDAEEGRSEQLVEQILEAARTSARDRALIDDFAYYNFYRTRRMELLIRAQYLSVPLLDEIGERIGLHRHEWTHLTPPELVGALTSPDDRAGLTARIEQRQAGWMLETNGLRSTRTLTDGNACTTRVAGFSAVLRAHENARADADATDPAVVGGKAAALAKLLSGGFRVPDFVVLTTQGVRALEDATVGDEVRRVLREAIDGVAGSGPFAVRSSASVEDGATHSWAGRFTSVLGVAPDEVERALSEVVASARSERVAAYAARVGSTASEVAMAVVIQRQVDADFAGVINTSVATSDGSVSEIEVVRGLGDRLVDGSSTPARYLVADDGSATVSGPDLAVPDELVQELARLAADIEAYFSSPQDVEFAVNGTEVHVLQSRPLTGPAAGPTAVDSGDANADAGLVEVVAGLSGHVAARVSGTVVKPAAPSDGGRLGPGKTVVLRAATPVWDSVIFQAAALVTDEGGSTSHAIRVANELSIPAVVGTRVATSSLAADESVIVDTTGGTSKGRVLRQGTL